MDSNDGACFLCDIAASVLRDSKPNATSRFTRVNRRLISILSPCSRKTFATAEMKGEPFVVERKEWKPKMAYIIHLNKSSFVSHMNFINTVVKVDRRIRWSYTTTILRLRIGARLTRYRNCKFHNFAGTISRHADGISWYSVPPSAGPLFPLVMSVGVPTSHNWTPLITRFRG